MMTQFKDKYHKAARDGFLDILREASRKDSDTRDEDGMTPVMWSAFYGRLDALRLLMSRGGNPDLTDYLGNSALHHAAANGHLPCCTFLVNFGANIWSLDNDLHSALDIAVLRNQREVIDFLDSVVGKQRAVNKRMSAKLHERCVAVAEKRRKQYEKMQVKARRRLEKEELLRNKERQKMTFSGDRSSTTDVENRNPSASMSAGSGQLQSFRSSRSDKVSVNDSVLNQGSVGSHIASGTNAGVARKVGKKKGDVPTHRGREFHITEDIGGKKSVRSLTGLRRDSEILYATNDSHPAAGDRASRAISEPEFLHNSQDGEAPKSGEASLFERPGFGSVSFLSKPNVSDALFSLPGNADGGSYDYDYENHHDTERERNEADRRSGNAEINRSPSFSDSIGTAGSLLKRMKNLPWSEDEVENLDDDLAINTLELFLACHCLTECASILTREKIDLDALLLCDDDDLKKIGLHLGPRKKLMDAIEKRKKVIESPGHIFDTYF